MSLSSRWPPKPCYLSRPVACHSLPLTASAIRIHSLFFLPASLTSTSGNNLCSSSLHLQNCSPRSNTMCVLVISVKASLVFFYIKCTSLFYCFLSLSLDFYSPLHLTPNGMLHILLFCLQIVCHPN